MGVREEIGQIRGQDFPRGQTRDGKVGKTLDVFVGDPAEEVEETFDGEGREESAARVGGKEFDGKERRRRFEIVDLRLHCVFDPVEDSGNRSFHLVDKVSGHLVDQSDISIEEAVLPSVLSIATVSSSSSSIVLFLSLLLLLLFLKLLLVTATLCFTETIGGIDGVAVEESVFVEDLDDVASRGTGGGGGVSALLETDVTGSVQLFNGKGCVFEQTQSYVLVPRHPQTQTKAQRHKEKDPLLTCSLASSRCLTCSFVDDVFGVLLCLM